MTNRHLLAELAQGRNNNYNLLRFLAALLVLVSHSYPLTQGIGSGEPLADLVDKDMGKLAVDVFFVTSGFLVTGSLMKRHDPRAFLVARMRRVMPGLIAAVAFCVFAVGLFHTELGVGAYLGSLETWRFAGKNVLLLGGAAFSLPGVFADLPLPNVVNGSLWTLPQEARLYVLLALIGLGTSWLGSRLRQPVFGFAVTALAVLLVVANGVNHFRPFLSNDPLQVGSMFFIGSALYFHRTRIVIGAPWCVGAGGLLAASLWHPDVFFIVYQFTLPVLVLGLAYLPGGRLRLFNRLGDYSYGLYLYAFPVQQMVAAAGVRETWIMAVISLLLTLPLAILSWHALESRFLKTRHPVRAEKGPLAAQETNAMMEASVALKGNE